MASYVLLEQARHIEALVLDVDGILSDGFVTLTNSGDEIKSLIFVMA
jgi:Low specificity phosphatase (HAD superfamily)